MELGQNIKKLRKENDLSQEMLAERLGVSFQSISRWERGECYPDITLLPSIANFFGVSLDDLMGMSKLSEQEEVKKIVAQLDDCETHRDGKRMIEIADEAAKKYPGNLEILAWYVYACQNTHPEKCIETAHYVLDRSTDNSLRNWVISTLASIYKKTGNMEKAIETANTLPHYYNTSCDTLRNLLTGEELKMHIEHQIIDLAYEFWSCIHRLYPLYPLEKKIELLKKCNAIYDACYECDDMPLKLSRKVFNFQAMAEVSLKEGKLDEGLQYMEECVSLAEIHDALPDKIYSKNLLYSVHPYDRQYEAHKEIKPDLLNDFETEDEFYVNIREREAYKKLIERLKG